jgi:hypothetical protein
MRKAIDVKIDAEWNDRGGAYTIERNGKTNSAKLDADGRDANGRSVAQILAEALSGASDRRTKPRKEKRG